MIDQFAEWLFSQEGGFLIGFSLGVMSSYVFIKKVNDQRFESLEKSVQFLKDLLDKTKRDVEEADEKCERRVQMALQENERLRNRINFLEDSRLAIIQQTHIKQD